MKQPDQAWWAKARAARDRLEASIMQDANVRMIGIGLDPERQSTQPVLIVTIRHDAAAPANVPNHIDGIPVRIVYGDYQLEQGE